MARKQDGQTVETATPPSDDTPLGGVASAAIADQTPRLRSASAKARPLAAAEVLSFRRE
jgi:hypothetical protein